MESQHWYREGSGTIPVYPNLGQRNSIGVGGSIAYANRGGTIPGC